MKFYFIYFADTCFDKELLTYKVFIKNFLNIKLRMK